MIMGIAKHWGEMIFSQVPKREHILIAQILLKCPQSLLAHVEGPDYGIGCSNCAQERRMDEELARIEHLPPVGIAILRQRLTLVGHMSIGQRLKRPEAAQVVLRARSPLGIGGSDTRKISGVGSFEETPAVVVAFGFTRRTMTLERVGHC